MVQLSTPWGDPYPGYGPPVRRFLSNYFDLLFVETAENRNSVRVRFLSRVSIRTRDIDNYSNSICLSVRNVPVLDENGLT